MMAALLRNSGGWRVIALAVLAWPDAAASAQTEPAKPAAAEASRPITDKSVTATDVLTTPLSDLNIQHGRIPQVLIDAEAHPYRIKGLASCPRIAGAVREIDAVLGDDIDLQAEARESISVGRVARSVVGSFIPFRGIIRELSGANAQQKKIEAAIYAGMARRAFLKGYGEARGCRYPARSATAQDAQRQKAAGGAGQSGGKR